MPFRSLLAGFALLVAATAVEAGPFRRNAQSSYRPSSPPAYPPTFQPVYRSPAVSPTGVLPTGVIVTSPTPTVASATDQVGGFTPVLSTTGFPDAGFAVASGSTGDGLDEVNAQRAARGLRPFLRDEGLTQAARECARFRAANGLFGHTGNDFAFVPAGSTATSAGCAAYPAAYGWMSCCVYDNYTYAGAAWVTGRDGRRYMHLFVR